MSAAVLRPSEPSPPPPDSSSAVKKRSRSTTGCSNCKKRKLKCDETKPRCTRCAVAGVVCPGYPSKKLRWSSKHEVNKSSNAHTIGGDDAGAQGLVEDGREGHDAGGNKSLQDAWSHTFPVSENVQLGVAYEVDAATSLASNTFDLDFHTPFETQASGKAARTPSISDTLGFDGSTLALCDTNVQEALWHSHTDATDGDHINNSLMKSTVWDPGPQQNQFLGADMSSMVSFGSMPVGSPSPFLNSSLLHVPTLLVEYYFQKVCRECSTFDSSLNPFRTMVSEMRRTSASVDFVIQSLAASKLADDMPRMKIVGIEAQLQALEVVKNECLLVNALHDVSDEGLYTTLLLGMTTSWHVREDLGLEYLALANRIVAARADTQQYPAKPNLQFFQNALKYWNMIASLVSEVVDVADGDVGPRSPTYGPSNVVTQKKKVMPHPWAGVSPQSQELFGQVLRLVRKARAGSRKITASSFSRNGINDLTRAITSAERLEAQCWSIRIPAVDEVEVTGDPDTPPIHHVLTAKAYLLVALLHIYMTFPDVLQSRLRTLAAAEQATQVGEHAATSSESASDSIADNADSLTLSKSWLWPDRSTDDPNDAWTRDLGIRIVECLEAIGVESGTRVVHPPLLLSVSTALILSPTEQRTSAAFGPPSSTASDASEKYERLRRLSSINALNLRIRQCRQFITMRLEVMQARMRFHAIDNILKVVREVWSRADAGAENIFWMDVMSELRCESLFG